MNIVADDLFFQAVQLTIELCLYPVDELER
jgi:hypothetical protein